MSNEREGSKDSPSPTSGVAKKEATSKQSTSKKSNNSKKSFVRRFVRRILLLWLVVLVVMSTVLIVRTLTFGSKQLSVSKESVETPEPLEMAKRLAVALRFATVSDEGTATAGQAFYDLHEHLRQSFPLTHQELVRENVADYSLLYTWRGSSSELPALILAAHLDVVPADGKEWEHPPFSGEIDEEYIYGRGSLDDKVSVLAILEAVEQLLRQGFRPKRTVYLAFGHDEELGGHKGAASIAELLAARGVQAEATLDEGLVITEGILDGIDVPLALIGVAEKGLINVELTAHSEGGHSSMPPKATAVGVLSRAIVAIQSAPMPGSIDGAVAEMFSYVGPEFGFGKRLVMANLWLFGSLVRGNLSENPATDALLRTTTAPTMIESGIKSNVLPREARAIVNFRIKPGDTGQDVLEHLERTISDKRVSIKALEGFDPKPASSSTSRIYDLMARSIRGIDPSILVAPGLMLGFTDSRHYAGISDNIYRFTALRMGSEDLKRLHGNNERIAISNYAEVVAFNILFLRQAAGSPGQR